MSPTKKAIGRFIGCLIWVPVWMVIPFTIRTRILVICGGEVLVIKKWLSIGQWSLPGGGKHRGEDPLQAVVRELQEEVGVVVKKTQLRSLGLMEQKKGQPHRFYGYTVLLHKKPTLQLQKNEIAEAIWTKPEAVQNLRTEQHVKLLLAAWQKQR